MGANYDSVYLLIESKGTIIDFTLEKPVRSEAYTNVVSEYDVIHNALKTIMNAVNNQYIKVQVYKEGEKLIIE